MTDGTDEDVRVSVIVPVFEPGPGFDDLIRSLDAQTLDAAEFEIILCDDGSGEETRARLAEVAATRPHVRVLTLEHTGWPGTPRNHGVAAARGRYIFFADQDDRLFENGLRAMCDYADENTSDVLVAKVVGVGRRIPSAIFRRDIPHAELGRDPLLELLTPHKLFRTSFITRNGIRFPDGRVRLEDHLFVVQAYFAAGTISVLASEPCYAWLKNEGSASSSRIDPETYFPSLAAVLDIVDQNTEPGRLRDTLLRHWYRGKILKRIEGRRMVRYPDEYRTRFLDVVVPLVRDRFGDGVQAGLAFPQRVRSELLRADRRDDLLAFATFESELECVAEVTSVTWIRGGRLRLNIRARILRDGDDALIFDTSDSGAHWRLPDGLGADTLPMGTRDAKRDLEANRVVLSIEQPEGRRAIGRAPLRSQSGGVDIDPLAVFARGGRGAQPLSVTVRYAGWSFETPLRTTETAVASAGRTPILAGRGLRLQVRPDGTIALRPGSARTGRRDAVARTLRRARRVVGRALPAP